MGSFHMHMESVGLGRGIVFLSRAVHPGQALSPPQRHKYMACYRYLDPLETFGIRVFDHPETCRQNGRVHQSYFPPETYKEADGNIQKGSLV